MRVIAWTLSWSAVPRWPNRRNHLEATFHAVKQLGAGLLLATLLTCAECATMSTLDSVDKGHQPSTTQNLSYPSYIFFGSSKSQDGFGDEKQFSQSAPAAISELGNPNLKGCVQGAGETPLPNGENPGIGPAAEGGGKEEAEGNPSVGRRAGRRITVSKLTAIIAGALLLLPFGASTIPFVREKHGA